MRVNLKAPNKEKLINSLKKDAMMKALMTADYSQIDTWVDNNVNSMGEAQEVIKRLLKSVKYLLTDLIKEANL